MHRLTKFMPIATLVFGLVGLSPLIASARTPTPDYTRRVHQPFATVLAGIQKAALANGFKVSGHHDVAASIRKAGLQHEPYVVVEMCNARIAAGVLKAEPRLGALMPCRIAIFQEGTTTVVSTILPSRLAALFGNPTATAAARQVDHRLRLIINQVAP